MIRHRKPCENYLMLLERMYKFMSSSDNISGFSSHCNKTIENVLTDDRKEVFDKLGILDVAGRVMR